MFQTLTNIFFAIIVNIWVCDRFKKCFESLQPGWPELLVVIVINCSLLIVQSPAVVVVQNFIDFSKNFELLGCLLFLIVRNAVRMNLQSLLVIRFFDCGRKCLSDFQNFDCCWFYLLSATVAFLSISKIPYKSFEPKKFSHDSRVPGILKPSSF